MVSSNLYIGIYNNHSYQAHTNKLQIEVEKIKYHVIGRGDIRERGTGRVNLNNRTSLLFWRSWKSEKWS